MLLGIGIFIILRFIPALNRNLEWARVFSHELSHTVAGMLMLHRIHYFRAGEKEGVMTHSGRWGNMFISLAPYTMFLFTLPLLIFRGMGQNAFIYILDLLIGFTFAFHISCFWVQTRTYQTDLQKVGYAKSFLYIAFCHLFNISLIILTVRKGIWGAIAFLFSHYWADFLKLIPGI